jgi:hypothetical protein
MMPSNEVHSFGWLVNAESPSLVLVINDTKLLMPCVKCFELGISNTCDEGVCGKEWWPQDHKKIVHGHEMMIMVIKHEMDMEQSDQGKGITIGFSFCWSKMSREVIDQV